MEEMMKKPCFGLPPPSPSANNSSLGMHKESQRISKVKQKIRIVHIFAPEIIKTDVANFRELVQRLTGKPSPRNNVLIDHRPHRNIKKQRQSRRSPPLSSLSIPSSSPSSSSMSEDHDHHHEHDHHENRKVESMENGGVLVKEEGQEEEDNDDEEMTMMWNGANYLNNNNNNNNSSLSISSGSGSGGLGLLGGFGEDLDGMIQELGEFPLLQPTHHLALLSSSTCLASYI